jgi:hypothetical protein
MHRHRMIGLPLVSIAALTLLAPPEVPAAVGLEADKTWENGIGEGFKKNANSFEIKASRAFGTTETGSSVAHDLWLAQLQFGIMLADVMEPEYWFGGNLEVVGLLMAGGQERPHPAYFTGANGGLRYHFRTGTPIVPFLAGSFGVGITDIDDADATGKFQFNEEIGAGVRYFFDRSKAVTLEYSLWHISNGGFQQPNNGVNAHVLSLGFSCMF